jgi:hypothetical protein
MAMPPDPSVYPAHVTDAANYSWRERDVRRPTIPEGDIILFEEPGRIIPGTGMVTGTDFRSHYFILSVPFEGGPAVLWVQHGAGEQHWPVGGAARLCGVLGALDSDRRFAVLYALHDAHQTSFHQGVATASARYETAFVEGRLRKRKVRGANAYQVSIRLPQGEGLIVGGVVQDSP